MVAFQLDNGIFYQHGLKYSISIAECPAIVRDIGFCSRNQFAIDVYIIQGDAIGDKVQKNRA